MSGKGRLVRTAGIAAWIALTIAAATALAQDTTPPREMDLPAAGLRAPDPEPLRVQLDGGLVAYVVADATVPLVSLRAIVGAGSADAPGGAAYVRALRSGPASMPPGAMAAALQRMAARFEITQTATRTEIELQVAAEDVAEALPLFAALLREPLRAPVAVASERSAVESATGESGPVLYEGSLNAAVQLLRDRVFAAHPYATTARADGDAAGFAARFVAPGNVVLAIGGDLDEMALREELQRLFGDWSGAGVEMPQHPVPDPPAERAVLVYPVEALQGWVALGHELPAVPMQDEAPLAVMNYILGGGHFDTRLFRVTRDMRGLTNDDSGFPEPNFRGPGLYSFRTYGRPEAVRLLIELTLVEIERIRNETVTEEELFVARGALADGDFSLWFRDGAATARTYAIEWLQSRGHEGTGSWQERVRAVTAEQVLDAAQRYLHPERMQIVVVGPIDRIEAAPAMEGEGGLDSFGTVIQGGVR